MSIDQASNGSERGFGRDGARFLMLGGIGMIAYAFATPGRTADFLFIALTAAAGAAVALRIRRGAALPLAWLAVAISLASLTLAGFVAGIAAEQGSDAIRSVADVLFMASYAPLFLAAFRFGRGARPAEASALLDTGIVTIAAIPIVWQLIVAPHLLSSTIGPAAFVSAGLPVLDILLVSLAMPLILFRRVRSTSGLLFVAGLAALTVGDAGYATRAMSGLSLANLEMNLAWLAAYTLLGAAAVVPSGLELGSAAKEPTDANDYARLIVVAVAVLAPAGLTLTAAAEHARPDLLFLGLMCFIVAALVAVRLVVTIGQVAVAERRFRRFMTEGGVVAAIQDATGRYVYMNESAADLVAQDHAAFDGAADETRTVQHAGRAWHTKRFAVPGSAGMTGLVGLDITERLEAEEAIRFQARLLASVQDAVVVIDRKRRIQYWNAGAEAVFGYAADEVVGQPLAMLVTPGTEAAVGAMWRSLLAGDREVVDWQMTRRDGTAAWLSVRVSRIVDDEGRATAYLGIANDVTERKRSELESSRLAAAIVNATDAVIVTDAGDVVTDLNPAFERMTGLTAADFVGRPIETIGESRAFARALTLAKGSESGWRGDIVGRRRDGSDLIGEMTISPIYAADRTPAGYVTIARDVTRERAAEHAAERRLRERSLVKETLAALRTGEHLETTAAAICANLTKLPEAAMATIILFDHDRRATVIGQALRDGPGITGQTIPAARSTYLRSRANDGPWVERWTDDATHPLEKTFNELGIIAQAFAPIVVDGTVIGLLIAGTDVIDAIDSLTERLPALLDFAAISATLLGGPGAVRVAIDRQRAAIRSAIDRSAFWPVFQPIVDLSSGKARGFEALTRFEDGTAPDIRFEEAHAVGLGLELEAACLRSAFAAAWRLPPSTWLNVNVSPDAVLGGVLEDTLPRGFRDVVVEITEHHVITDYAAFRAAIAPLRSRVRIAVDDAGAGFASLRHILELAPAMVKLDRSLVVGIDGDAAREAVVSGMVRFTRSAGIELVAEGIEEPAELEALHRLGVEYGQGYLVGRPAPIAPVLADPVTEPPPKPRRVGLPARAAHGKRRTPTADEVAP